MPQKITSRDGFKKTTRDQLARRAGYRCSNPNCRLLTTGPSDAPNGTSDVGVAAHITAASKGGSRYDQSLRSEERSSPENGIWLCQIHAKLIDDDPIRFHVDLLKEWKLLSEKAARLEIEELEKGLPRKHAADIEALGVYSRAFDRDAFKMAFHVEMSLTGFDHAISDTVVALSTGHLRDREGKTLAQTIGRTELHNSEWSEKISVILDLLRSLRRRFQIAKADGQIVIHSRNTNYELFEIQSHDLRQWMDATRLEILFLMSQILAEAGLPALPHSHLRQNRW